MKTHSLFVLLLSAAFSTLLLGPVLADGTTAPATGGVDGTAPNTQRMEKLKAAMAQLDLSDAQKDQIKQIRSTVTDKTQRRQQIMAVLTPDQKAKLIQMLKEHREQSGAGTADAN